MSRWHSLPPEVYALVEHTPATVLLESATPGVTEGGADCWTRLFTAPERVCVAWQAAEIPWLFREIESAVAAGRLAAGFFTYECGNCFEPAAGMRAGRAGTPLAWFGIYERCYPFDHEAGEFLGGDPPGLERFRGGGEEPAAELPVKPEFALTEKQYAARIAAIHEWIRAGDIYQLNFTAPCSVQAPGSKAALYARLRERQPVAYGAFLHWQAGRRILSFSPELFFRLEDEGNLRRITARPMKGTAPRGRTTREDRAQAEWLRNDDKNRSENLMIVDLLRNDLGRLAIFGTVRASPLFTVERYRTLWQMTSTVSGELRPEVGFHEIFRALFPCGSITGAPKVRAMQLIAEVEEQPRGVYTGAIGFFSARRTIFNVAIRTLELDGDQGTMGVGGGIVIDSDAAGEYRECMLKAEFLTGSASRFPDHFSLVETMLWQGGYPLIELHLDRLEDSADYFGFPCDRAAVKVALESYARGFADAAARKVRLLIAINGELHIAGEILAASGVNPGLVCVRISKRRTDPRDPMLFHKTTHRPVYAEAFKAAMLAGFADVLFLNRAGEVTEGAISNIFVVKDGRWLTPPVECGLLAGVYRRHLLETGADVQEQGPQQQAFVAGVQERVLYPEDLQRADAVYIANAVRGLRRVAIDWES
jgi:para-aminobenzoate synthetase/4-amino-4-deoxychorismate lyase